MQLYFPGRILQLKAQHKEEANRWLACLHSLHLIAVNSSFTQTANRQQSAAHSHASDLHQHDSAASVASPPVKHKLVDQPDDGVLFIKVEATGPKPASPRQHRISQLSHLSIEGSGLSFTPLSDHAAHSPFLGTRDQHADGLQPKAETAICSRCKSIASITLLAASQEELQDVSEGVHGGRHVDHAPQHVTWAM